MYSKKSGRSEIKYDLADNSNLSFNVGADILNLLILFELFISLYVL